MLTNPSNSKLLPFAEAFGRVYAKNIGTCFYKGGNTLCIVAGVNSGSYDIALFSVKKLVGVFFVSIIVLSENEVF